MDTFVDEIGTVWHLAYVAQGPDWCCPELRLVIATHSHLYYDNGLEAVDPLSRIPPRSCVASNESRWTLSVRSI